MIPYLYFVPCKTPTLVVFVGGYFPSLLQSMHFQMKWNNVSKEVHFTPSVLWESTLTLLKYILLNPPDFVISSHATCFAKRIFVLPCTLPLLMFVSALMLLLQAGLNPILSITHTTCSTVPRLPWHHPRDLILIFYIQICWQWILRPTERCNEEAIITTRENNHDKSKWA